jgi:hypothetical protein
VGLHGEFGIEAVTGNALSRSYKIKEETDAGADCRCSTVTGELSYGSNEDPQQPGPEKLSEETQPARLAFIDGLRAGVIRRIDFSHAVSGNMKLHAPLQSRIRAGALF